jgi:N-acetylmuramoyl-L-alanine amidase
MKKFFMVLTMTVAICFTAAVVLCVRALQTDMPVFAQNASGMKIVLDAGHGGIDGGITGVNTGVKESDLNLQITFLLKSRLEEDGFEVVLTRKTEAGLYGTAGKGFKRRDMEKRKEIIEKENPDLVVSIHQNLYPTRKTRGAQVFYNAQNEKGKLLAQGLQNQLNGLYAKQGVKNRSIMPGDYFMLTCTQTPSVIIECGFLSNAEDEKLLISNSWQNQLAQTIATGVIEYFSALTS